MLKVAITGNIASGKSTVEKALQTSGYVVLDTDKVCHNLLFSQNVKEAFIYLKMERFLELSLVNLYFLIQN